MYREEILDHYRNPRNEGEIEGALDAEGENPSCGDHVHIYVKVEDGEVEQVSHETDGCAISTAGVSVLSEKIKGMDVEEVEDLDRDWMIDQLGIDISPMRVKCAVLGLKTVQDALG
ncbi:MAG: iron-sulfur cluster assembly scaffold protein [Candidatus Nanohaloarchaea archaeon]